uniref:phosphonate C-P lyase system protein PhnG n=1 Tax=Falsiroseomonas oryziterrae TaxID=2911368 RepID=UPI001EFF60B2
ARQAELAALCDALLLDAAARPEVEAAVIRPLATAQAARHAAEARKAAATRVQFFTMTQMR